MQINRERNNNNKSNSRPKHDQLWDPGFVATCLSRAHVALVLYSLFGSPPQFKKTL